MIKVYAPASIGNVGVGFDILGVAIKPINNILLGDCISIEKSKKFQIKSIGKFSVQLPKNSIDNIVWHAWKLFSKKRNLNQNILITLEKNLPIGSGLGSSASSIVSCLMALNKFYKTNLTKKELLLLMGELEGKISGNIHYDNVAPCFLGGLQLIIEDIKNISQTLPIFQKWFWIISWPGFTLSTAESRKAIPKKQKHNICIQHSRNIATFIHALHSQQSNLAIRYMKDVIAEPNRIKLIPLFSKTKEKLINLGALNCSISGSGPTIFAICKEIEKAKNIENWLNKNYILKKKGFVYICTIDSIGARYL